MRIKGVLHIQKGNGIKRKILIKKLEQAGFEFYRHSSNHDIYKRGNVQEAVERHSDIPEGLARKILKRNGIL